MWIYKGPALQLVWHLTKDLAEADTNVSECNQGSVLFFW